MNQPLVSICIPTFNRPDFLSRAVRSCLAQTYKTFEIIITDNSDGNASGDMIAKLNDPRIAYHKNEENIGGVRNLLKVMSLAKGTYITLLMDDDLLKPDALELMVKAFEKHPTVGIVMAPMALIDRDDRRIFPYFYIFRKMHYRYRFKVGDGLVKKEDVLRHFLIHDYPCCVPSGIMYRGEAIKKVGSFDLNSGFAIDLDLCMRIAVYYDFYYIDKVLSSFRVWNENETSTSHQQGFKVDRFYYITRKILNDPNAMNLFPESEREWLKRESIYFCSCRTLLNVQAGLRAHRWKTISDVFRLIWREDPYFINKVRLPSFVAQQIAISFSPPAKPLPPE